jgi:uncharacterized protein
MAKEYAKPLPQPTGLDAPLWEAAKNHELRLQKCLDCGNIWYPPSVGCPQCLSARYEWAKMSGKGKVWSWVIFHQRYFPAFAGDIPYNVVVVRLAEGPLMTSNLVGIKNRDITCDLPVEVFFDAVTPEVALLKFKPAP